MTDEDRAAMVRAAELVPIPVPLLTRAELEAHVLRAVRVNDES